MTGTVLNTTESYNDFTVLENGLLVVHCDVQRNIAHEVYVVIGHNSEEICYTNNTNLFLNKSKEFSPRCKKQLIVRVDEKRIDGKLTRLSFALHTTWRKLFSSSLKDFYRCQCERNSDVVGKRASLHLFGN